MATDFQAALDTPAGRRRPEATPTKAASSGEANAQFGLAEEGGDVEEGEEEDGWGDDEF